MPVFEGLFGSFDNIVMDLLWYLLVWHTLAKLSVHSDSTLEALDTATRSLGWSLRRFKSQFCDKKTTYETNREYAARVRRQAKKGKGKKTAVPGRKERSFNLSTYKLHSLGDYVAYIRLFGPSDGWSTLRVRYYDSLRALH
jgi:hypothetical protein